MSLGIGITGAHGSSGGGESAAQLKADLLAGRVVPALASNLYSDTDQAQNGQSFIERTTGGSASVRSGKAMLKKLYGAVARTQQKVTESISSSKTEVANFSVVVGQNVESDGTYIYDGTDWKKEGVVVDLEELSITLTGTPVSGDQFTVIYVGPEEIEVEYSYQSRFGFDLTQATFRAKADESVQKGQSHSFVFTYGNDGWTCDGVTYTGEQMNSVWGITTTGDYMAGDTITINYTRASNGKLEFAAPTALKALGLNSCNCFDPNRMVLANKTIDASGAIVDAQGSYVAYARAVYNASNTGGYAVYDKNGSVTKVGWVATLPTASTTGITLGTPNAQLSHVTFAANGYIVVACTNVDGLCIHPSWSGIKDETYAAYSESVFSIPSTDADGIALVGAGWAVGAYKNVFDFSAKTYTKNVTRVAYSAAALAQLLEDNPTWVEDTDYSYDNDWIYYHQTGVVSNLAATADGVYYCHDYSVEMFVGTSVAPLADFAYGQNLVDKPRGDVVVKNNLVHVTIVYDDDTTETLNMVANI